MKEELREIIWYELGDGLNATDVDEAVESIINLVDKELPDYLVTPLALDRHPPHKRDKIITAITNYNKAINDMRAKLKGVSNGDI